MRVCIIGGGASGLVTAKHLKEEGIEVEILEKRDGLGGLWYFEPQVSTVSDNTHATTSKTYLQFSDFPMEKDISYFPHHSVYLDYVKRYAEHHNLLPLIKLSHEVINLQKQGEQWEVTVRHGEETYKDKVDAVAICSGLHHVPRMPDLPGQENYKGINIHSSVLGSIEELRDKRVVVVGGGESATDLVHELAAVAKEVYISLRKGQIITLSWGSEKLPADHGSFRSKVWLPRKFLHDFHHCCIPNVEDQYSAFRTVYTILSLPVLLLTLSFKRLIKAFFSLFHWKMWVALFKAPQRFGPPSGIELSKDCQELCQEPAQSEEEVERRFWELRHLFMWYSGGLHNTQPFIKSPEFFRDIAKGTAKVVPGIVGYTGDLEVEFDGSSKVEADAVVLCTGFKTSLPFFKPQNDEVLDSRLLYKNVFIPGESTLAFIGFARPNIGASPPVAEMQARWFSGVLSGRIQLPTIEQMKITIDKDSEHYNKSRKYHAERLTALIDYHVYMEQLAKFVGCRPQLWRLIFKPKLLFIFLFAPMASFQYRIHGYGANPEAAMKAIDRLPRILFFRVTSGIVLYFLMKPLFTVLGKLGLRQFSPLI
jgi:dimethylaniline monooxygenase (N-oxide forming)